MDTHMQYALNGVVEMVSTKQMSVLLRPFPQLHLFLPNKMLQKPTVFPRIDAAVFIYFVGQFGAVNIRGLHLFEGGVYSFRQCDPRRVPRHRPQHPAEVLSTSR